MLLHLISFIGYLVRKLRFDGKCARGIKQLSSSIWQDVFKEFQHQAIQTVSSNSNPVSPSVDETPPDSDEQSAFDETFLESDYISDSDSFEYAKQMLVDDAQLVDLIRIKLGSLEGLRKLVDDSTNLKH